MMQSFAVPPAMIRYGDIITLNRPVHDGDLFSRRHPRMTQQHRAKIFAPFAAPRVRLEYNPEIPVAPEEEARVLDTSLDEVYWPCSHSRAIPSFPSQLEWKIGLPWANTRGILNSPW